MSWQIFKNSILSVIKAGDALNSVDEMATLYATAYDTAIKSNGAGDTVNKIKIKNGNLPLMIQLFKINFYTGQASMVPYDWVGGMKPGILAYWQGAALQTSPIPIIPAIGSVVNIKIVSPEKVFLTELTKEAREGKNNEENKEENNEENNEEDNE